MIEVQDGEMIPDQVLGDHLVNQVDGENEKRLERTAGDLREIPDLLKIVNGIEIKIVMKMKRTEKLTKTMILIGKTVSGVLGMMVAGEERQLKRLLAGGTLVAVMNGIEVAVTLEMTGVVIFEIGVVKKGKEECHLPGQTGRK